MVGVALHVERIGQGAPTLLLLHGQGVNGAVWQPLLREMADWPGIVVVPDFRGHGRSPHARPYSIGQHAADVAALVEPDVPLVIVGHSMGGMVGLMLAGGCFGLNIVYTLAFGLKVSWSDEELAKARQFAATPIRWFATREEAVERFLRVSGMVGLADATSPVAQAGIVEKDGRFCLAADPATTLAAGAPVETTIAAARGPWRLACGATDPLVTIGELKRFDSSAMEIEGCGHSPHVEAPARFMRLIPRPR
jgi:pimeloyl-ACP methyl ester carboxylesterase